MSTQLTIQGRFVQGDLSLRKKTDDNNKPVLDKETGQQIEEVFIAVAVAKNDPMFQTYWGAYHAEAVANFASLFDANGQCSHPRFAWKIQDGDGKDSNGKSVADKPGFAGHWIFKMVTRYEPRCYIKDGHGNNQLLSPEDAKRLIKKGYHIAVAVTLDGNGVSPQGNGQAVPGLFSSPNLVLLVRPDTEIISGPDPTQAFAGINTQMPSGSAAPTGLAPPQSPAAGLPPLPSGGGSPSGPGGLSASPPALPAGAPPMPGHAPATGTPPVPPGPTFQMQPSAQGATRESLHALGWTDAQLIAHGHMVQVG